MSLDSLRHQRDVISLEAVSGETAQLSALAKLPAFLTSAKSAFQNQLDRSVKAVLDFASAFSSLASRLSRVDHGTVRAVTVQVPEGLKVDMLSYGQTLHAATANMKLIEQQMLTPFMNWLNRHLSSPGQLRTVGPTLQISHYKALDVSGMKAAIDKCFNTKGQAVSQIPYGQAVRRSGDWKELEKIQNDLNRDMSPGLHKQILNSTAELEVSIDTLVLRMSKEAAKYAPSTTVTQELVNTAFEVAEAIEFYATLRYRLQEFDHSLSQIGQHVLDQA